MTNEPFTMSVWIPRDSSADVRMRVGMALIEAALDRGLAVQQRRFEQSLVDNDAPVEHMADLLLWQYEEAQAWRAETLATLREELSEWCRPAN